MTREEYEKKKAELLEAENKAERLRAELAGVSVKARKKNNQQDAGASQIREYQP